MTNRGRPGHRLTAHELADWKAKTAARRAADWADLTPDEQAAARTRKPPIDPQLASVLRMAIPEWAALGATDDECEALAALLVQWGSLWAALRAMRSYVLDAAVAIDPELLGQLAQLADAAKAQDPAVGDVRDVCDRLALVAGLDLGEIAHLEARPVPVSRTPAWMN